MGLHMRMAPIKGVVTLMTLSLCMLIPLLCFFISRIFQSMLRTSFARLAEHKRGSVAAGVPRWAKNPHLVKFAHFYHSLPMGVREFALIMPGMIFFTVLVWRSDMFSPVSTAVMDTPAPTDFRGYRLEPMYGEKGILTGYRRVKEN